MPKKTGRKWFTLRCGRCEEAHTGYSGKLDAAGKEYVICGVTNKKMLVDYSAWGVKDVAFGTVWQLVPDAPEAKLQARPQILGYVREDDATNRLPVEGSIRLEKDMSLDAGFSVPVYFAQSMPCVPFAKRNQILSAAALDAAEGLLPPVSLPDIIKHDFMAPYDLTLDLLSQRTGIEFSLLEAFMNGSVSLTANMAYRFATYFGVTIDLLFNVERDYTLQTFIRAFKGECLKDALAIKPHSEYVQGE